MSDSLARRALARAAARLNARSLYAGLLPPLVLLTDERSKDPLRAAQALPKGSMVIVRARSRERRAALSSEMLKLAKVRGLVVLIADDPALAVRLNADGIHLPEARARESGHWRTRLPRAVITVSAHDLRGLGRLEHADAVLLAPAFATGSHPGGFALGPVRINQLARFSRKPVYALGGIDACNAGRLFGANYVGLAAISALSV